MTTRTLLVLALVSLTACGGGSGGGGGDDDGNPVIDAADDGDGPPPPPDAPPPNAKQLGSACTPDPNDTFGQGDCPAGFSCLSLVGATNPWCSKACVQNMDTCADGYTGPGLASCHLSITPAGGGAARQMCGIVCDDLTAGDVICPPAKCDGTCPDTLACTSDLNGSVNGGPMMVVAKGCQ